jgi:TrpR-related protein YerC/YecD
MTTPEDDWRNEDTTALMHAVLALDSIDEAERFFRDLCTRRELEEMTHRWSVVRHLAQGRSYRSIATETGISTATITRINQWLQHGAGGYQLILDRLGLAPEGDEA